MFSLNATPYFAKKVRKLIKKNRLLQSEILKTLEQLQLDPTNTKLRTHKVSTYILDQCFSSRVNGDIRIIWDYSENQINVLDLLDIGGHSGNSKVYR